MLQAALNGGLSRTDHPAVPLTPEDLVADARACSQAGATQFHIHPRNPNGRESIRADVVDDVVTQLRHGLAGGPAGAVAAPLIGVTTGAWIEPDLVVRIAQVRRWRAPSYTSVNLSEVGAFDVIRAALEAGIGVEAGVWSVPDALALGASGLGERLIRILVEPAKAPVEGALDLVAEIHDALDSGGLTAPRLQHGDGNAAWLLLEDALRRGLDTRIGLEDTFRLPDESIASGNADLVRAAVALGA